MSSTSWRFWEWVSHLAPHLVNRKSPVNGTSDEMLSLWPGNSQPEQRAPERTVYCHCFIVKSHLHSSLLQWMRKIHCQVKKKYIARMQAKYRPIYVKEEVLRITRDCVVD